MAAARPKTKVCTQCGKRKARTAFPLRDRRTGKRQGYCKLCHAARQRRDYAASGGRARIASALRTSRKRARIRQQLWEYLETHPCVDCQERDPVVLEFDHVRGRKLYAIANMVSQGMSWVRIAREIAKCEVRCANDHRRRTAIQLRWHSAR